MSTSNEWINFINAIEKRTRIFLMISIRLLVFVAFPGKLPGGLLGADWTKGLKTGWHWVDVCWRDEKRTWNRLGAGLPFRAFGGRQTAEVCSKFFLKRHFGGQNKLLNLASRTVNYGALNGPIIAHVLTERYSKWFYLIIFSFNDLKIPDQIHHCARTILVWFFASTLAVAKYQLRA